MPCPIARVFCALALTVSALTTPVASALGGGTEQFTRVFMPQSSDGNGAACLDGTPPVLYFRPGTGDGANKWMVYSQGGGWCTSDADCEGRSHGGLGSSIGYGPTMGNTQFMTTDKNMAPGWYNWNQVYMKYCDGASFSGNRDGTVLVKDKKLYYRGHRNLREMMKWTLDHGLGDGTDMIVSGGSAGGLSTYLHTAEWCHVFAANSLYDGGPLLDGQVQGKKKCAGAPDAGFFPDIEFTSTEAKAMFTTHELGVLRGGSPGNYAKELRWVYSNHNVTVNHMCQAHFKGNDEGKCMFAEHTAPFIPQPVLALNSIYDSWQIGRELPKGHDTELVNKLGRLMIDRVTKNVLQMNPKSGAWLTGCSEHTVTPNWMSAGVDGMRAPDVMAQWYSELDDAKPKRSWIAKDKFPCAACCNNFKPSDVEVEEAAIE